MPDAPPVLKHKTLGVQGVKVLDDAQGIVEAYVAGIGNKDSVGDIIRPGAFDRSLASRKPKGVWSHNWDLPVSKTVEIREVKSGATELPAKMKTAGIGGLYVKTQFNLNTQRGRDAYEDVKFYGDEAEWSIGYREVDTEWNKEAQANDLLEIELYEYSPVLFGANALTATVGVKSEEGDVQIKIDGVLPHQEADLVEAVKAALKLDAEVDIEFKKLHDYKGDGGDCEICNAPRNDADQHYGADDGDKSGEGDTKEKQAVPGSFEARQEAIAEAVEAENESTWTYAAATFDTSVVVYYETSVDNGDGSYSYESGYWSYDYSYDPGSGTVTLGDRSDVDLVATVVGKGAGESVNLAIEELLDASAIEDDGSLVVLSDPFEHADNKIGRVLSQANYDKLNAALGAITEVLGAASVVDPEVDTELNDPADLAEKIEAARAKLTSTGVLSPDGKMRVVKRDESGTTWTEIDGDKSNAWADFRKAVGLDAYTAAVAAAAAGAETELDPDEVPVALAQAVDAVLDEATEALAEGDVASAFDLLVAAETTIDQLIEVLGGTDADDIDTLTAEKTVVDMDEFRATLAAAAEAAK